MQPSGMWLVTWYEIDPGGTGVAEVIKQQQVYAADEDGVRWQIVSPSAQTGGTVLCSIVPLYY